MVTERNIPESNDYDGPRQGEPDPETVGPAILAWYALHGELKADPADVLANAAIQLATQLGEILEQDPSSSLPLQSSTTPIYDAKLLLGCIAELFGHSDLPIDDEARLVFTAELKRRRGRPEGVGKLSTRSLGWAYVAAEVHKLIEGGALQKVAVGKVAARLGLSDARVAGWYRKYRKSIDVRADSAKSPI